MSDSFENSYSLSASSRQPRALGRRPRVCPIRPIRPIRSIGHCRA